MRYVSSDIYHVSDIQNIIYTPYILDVPPVRYNLATSVPCIRNIPEIRNILDIICIPYISYILHIRKRTELISDRYLIYTRLNIYEKYP